MLELWGLQSTPSLPSLSGSLKLEVIVPEKVLSMVQIELLDVLTVQPNDLCSTELLERVLLII